MYSRRKFLVATGSSTVALAVGPFCKTLHPQSAPNTSIYGAAVAAQSLATGNVLVSGSSPNDWLAVQSTMNNCIAEWTANNRDSGFMAAVSNVSPSMVTTANLNQSALLQQIRLYQPQFTQADLTLALSVIDKNSAQIPTVLATMRTSGMSPYMVQAANQAGKLAAALNAGTINSASVRSQIASRIMQTPSPDYRAAPPGGGKTTYDCKADGYAVLGAGTACVVLTVMTMGAAPVLAGAAWAGIALWGGIGTGVWGAGHWMACGV